ncbi:MAG: DNA/RNA nuclease SfsA [Pseudomonadales bacterium]
MRIEPPLSRGILERRYKRFLADVVMPDGRLLTVHCPNTGAMLGCAEPGSPAWISDSGNPSRKYRHTLEVVVAATGRVGVNTARANRLVAEALADGSLPPLRDTRPVRAEVPIPDESGRFDFLVEDARGNACYIEVKNMTLCDPSGRGSFPDAVSERAIRHVTALARRVAAGERGVLLFCAQHTGVRLATLADEIHPAYGVAVREAVAAGVEVYAVGCRIEPDEIRIDGMLPVDLTDQRC